MPTPRMTRPEPQPPNPPPLERLSRKPLNAVLFASATLINASEPKPGSPDYPLGTCPHAPPPRPARRATRRSAPRPWTAWSPTAGREEDPGRPARTARRSAGMDGGGGRRPSEGRVAPPRVGTPPGCHQEGRPGRCWARAPPAGRSSLCCWCSGCGSVPSAARRLVTPGGCDRTARGPGSRAGGWSC